MPLAAAAFMGCVFFATTGPAAPAGQYNGNSADFQLAVITVKIFFCNFRACFVEKGMENALLEFDNICAMYLQSLQTR